ncbi:gustatory receptor 68a-like [Lutzomyia longipalpis]|uniref:Gustatory receptor n=2 Tax=Lutzomyia longipalpis TaxID=7200 RepID=A0A3F2ZDG4_LUTLO|nr:gustatory receptor 68a-like [Lutzomyia longipalpis]
MDVFTALSAALFIQRIICVSPFCISRDGATYSKWYIFNGILQIVVAFVIYIMNFNELIERNLFTQSNLQFSRQSQLTSVVGVFEIGITCIVFIVVLVVMYVKKEKQVEFLELIHKTDLIFEETFKIYPNNNQKDRNIRNGSLLFFTIYHFILSIALQFITYSFELTFQSILIISLYNYQVSAARFSNLTFVFYTDLVRKRFKLLERYVHGVNLSTEQDYLLIVDIFTTLQKSHEILNDIFGLINLFTSTHDFTFIVSQLFIVIWIANQMEKTMVFLKFIVVIFWFAPNVAKLVVVSNISEATARSIKKCKNLLYKDKKVDKTTMDIVENFSLRMKHFDDNYTAINFFPIDNTLLYTMIGALTTYLFVFIQFRMFEENYTGTSNSIIS